MATQESANVTPSGDSRRLILPAELAGLERGSLMIASVYPTAIVLGFAIWSIVEPLVRGSGGTGRWIRLAISLAGSFAIAWLVEDAFQRDRPELHPDNEPFVAARADFVTSATCRSCHPHEHRTWHDSFHRTMTQKATPENVLAKFDGQTVKVYGHQVRVGREGEQFWAEWGAGGRRDIVLVTGRHHMQMFWYPTGDDRELGLLPLAWVNEVERWVPASATFLRPPTDQLTSHDADWNLFCQQCHATGVEPRIDASGNVDTQVAELGIACESCHGPAKEHVAINRDPRRRYERYQSGEPDPTIVNPARLSAERASQVCGQCHGIGIPRDLPNYKLDGFVYRPGADLTETRFLSPGLADESRRSADDLAKIGRILEGNKRFLLERFWKDGEVRISGREYHGLIDSPCFADAKSEERKLSCLSCHELHQASDDSRSREEWTDDQLKPGMRTNDACLACHEQYSDSAALEAHTHHAPDSSGSSCYNCHMPYTTYGLLKAIRSHTISSPSIGVALEAGRPNACNTCHLDQSLAWSARHLETWYGIEQPKMSPGVDKIAAAPYWTLQGDAGQRALVAWYLGWEPAQKASGTDWMVPFLGDLLVDAYDVVRYIAYRSLKTIPAESRGGADVSSYDFLAPKEKRQTFAQSLLDRWATNVAPVSAQKRDTSDNHRLARDPKTGAPLVRLWKALHGARDNTPMRLEE